MWLWWIGNAVLLLLVTPLVLLLANRVIRAAVEVRRYADDILEHGVLLTQHLEPVPALAETSDLVAGARSSSIAYVGAVGPLL